MRAVNTTKRLELSIEQQRMRAATTVDEALPEISLIARSEGLDLNKAKDWKEVVRLYDLKNLNR